MTSWNWCYVNRRGVRVADKRRAIVRVVDRQVQPISNASLVREIKVSFFRPGTNTCGHCGKYSRVFQSQSSEMTLTVVTFPQLTPGSANLLVFPLSVQSSGKTLNCSVQRHSKTEIRKPCCFFFFKWYVPSQRRVVVISRLLPLAGLLLLLLMLLHDLLHFLL